jgi:hypothetical protein
MADCNERRTLHRIRKPRFVLHVNRDFLPLICLNAPGIYGDRKFQEWLNSVTLHGRPNEPENRLATWHWPGKQPGKDSDIFMRVSRDDCSDSDMPSHCWEAIVRALDAVFQDSDWECMLWLSNMRDVSDDEDWEAIRA